MIAYAIIGCAFAAAFGLFANPTGSIATKLLGGILGAVLGAVGGVAAGYIGHWYDSAVGFPNDPVFYWVGRWFLMLLPLAVGSGIAIAASGKFGKQLSDSMAGTILGTGLVTIIYCFTSGSATRKEGHNKILPAFEENRILLIALLSIIGITAFLLLSRKPKAAAMAAEDKAAAQA